MPVSFGQEEALNQTRAPVQATPAQPDQHLASVSFEGRREPALSLDLRPSMRPMPFYAELDSFAPEGWATARNTARYGQGDALSKVRGTGGEATHPKIGFEQVLEQELEASVRGFKIPFAPSSSKLVESEPVDHPVRKLQETHILSVMAEEDHGYRRPDGENAAILGRPHPQSGSRLAGRQFGMARQQNPAHFKKPRFGLPLSVPALPGTEYAGYYINDGMVPEQRRLPDQR